MKVYKKKEGIIFLIATIIIAIFSVYVAFNGIHHNSLSSSQWFVLLLTLFTSVANYFSNKKEDSYYPTGNIIIAIVILSCYIIPQLLKYVA